MLPKSLFPIFAASILCILPASAFGADAVIGVTDFTFTPADVTINEGDKVTWSDLLVPIGPYWSGRGINPGHNVARSSSAGSNVYIGGLGFRSGEPGAVDTFEKTFNTAGTFYFICENHILGFGMKGSVTVVGLANLNNLFVDFGAPSNGPGTEGSPFKNLANAVDAVNANGTINLEPGNSTETFTGPDAISNALFLLNNTPAGGSVTVGDPGARSADRSGGFKSRPPGDASADSSEDSDS